MEDCRLAVFSTSQTEIVDQWLSDLVGASRRESR